MGTAMFCELLKNKKNMHPDWFKLVNFIQSLQHFIQCSMCDQAPPFHFPAPVPVEMKMKWNASVLGHFFLHYEGWIESGTAWANEVKFLRNLPPSSIEPAIFYSWVQRATADHGEWLKWPFCKFCLSTLECNVTRKIFHLHPPKGTRETWSQ